MPFFVKWSVSTQINIFLLRSNPVNAFYIKLQFQLMYTHTHPRTQKSKLFYNSCKFHVFSGFNKAVFSYLTWCGGFEACLCFSGVSVTQQEEDKKGGLERGKKKKSQHIKTKSTGGSTSSLSELRRLKGQWSWTASSTYLMPLTLVHQRRCQNQSFKIKCLLYTGDIRKVDAKLLWWQLSRR